jgi:hypothetical protein
VKGDEVHVEKNIIKRLVQLRRPDNSRSPGSSRRHDSYVRRGVTYVSLFAQDKPQVGSIYFWYAM